MGRGVVCAGGGMLKVVRANLHDKPATPLLDLLRQQGGMSLGAAMMRLASLAAAEHAAQKQHSDASESDGPDSGFVVTPPASGAAHKDVSR